MDIYKKVQEACKEKGISVFALEAKLNYSRGSICKWDEHNPSIARVKAVADALEKPISFFIE